MQLLPLPCQDALWALKEQRVYFEMLAAKDVLNWVELLEADGRQTFSQALCLRTVSEAIHPKPLEHLASLLFHADINPYSSGNALVIPFLFPTVDGVDSSAFRSACEKLLLLQPNLSAVFMPTFRTCDGRVCFDFEIVDFSAVHHHDQAVHMAFVSTMAQPFHPDLGHCTRFRIFTHFPMPGHSSALGTLVVVVLHHICVDLSGTVLCLDTLSREYCRHLCQTTQIDDACAHPVPAQFLAPPLSSATCPTTCPHPPSCGCLPYDTYLAAEQERCSESSPANAIDKVFWQQQCHGFRSDLFLPSPGAESTAQSPAHWTDPRQFVPIVFDSHVTALLNLAHAEGTSPFAVMLATWQLFLHRLTGAPDVAVWFAKSLRGPQFAHCAGYCVNVLPSLSRLCDEGPGAGVCCAGIAPSATATFRSYVRTVKAYLASAGAHTALPTLSLLRCFGHGDAPSLTGGDAASPRGCGGPIFRSMFGLHRLPPEATGWLPFLLMHAGHAGRFLGMQCRSVAFPVCNLPPGLSLLLGYEPQVGVP